MKRIYFFIDGFNFYHSVNYPQLFKYKWLNYANLAKILIKQEEKIEKILFFTAFATWDQAKIARHKILIRALDSFGVETIEGRFKTKIIKCRLCKKDFEQPIEKQTDVNIAVNLLRYAVLDKFDKAYIISGDTDLIPAITAAKDLFPQKEIAIVFPFRRKGKELAGICDFHIKIKEDHLKACILPDPVILPDGSTLSRPNNWV
ncbi:MAG: NYN domain-containing protein [Candidatus Aminicenantales bacterium]